MNLFDLNNPHFVAIIIACAIWELVWKGFALWKAAKNSHWIWFVCIIIFNTVGVLPIVYLLLNRNKKG